MKGLTASAVAGAGVASAAESASGDARSLSAEERAQLRAPFEDLQKARAFLLEHTETLRSELAERGYLPSANPAALGMNRLETGFRKRVRGTDEAFRDVRVKAGQTDEYGEWVNVDTWVRYRGYFVSISVSTKREVASGLVIENGETVAFLRETDAGIEDVGTTSHTYECTTDVCDDCCGTFDCTKEYTIYYDPQNSNQSFCGCVDGTTICCEDGCGTLCLC